MPPPHKLYKYCSFSVFALGAICSAEAYYSSPNAFNDPMDSQPDVDLDISTADAEHLVRKFMALRKFKSEHIEREIGNHRYMATDDSEESPESPRTDGDRFRRILEREILGELHRKMAAKGVFSLSESYSSSLMWSHYADHHKGLCLEYDTTENDAPDLAPIDYAASRVVRAQDIFDWIIKDDMHAYRRIVATFFYAKSDEWQYEHEWRDLSDDAGVHSVRFRLSGVHFGTRTESAVRETIIRILSNNREVEIYGMYDSGRAFRLERYAVERDYIEGSGIREPSFVMAKAFDEVTEPTRPPDADGG